MKHFIRLFILFLFFGIIVTCQKDDPAPDNGGTDIETGKLTDSRDGKTYNIVKIGNQWWMSENLAYLPSVSPPSGGSLTEPYYYVYGYNGTNVAEAKATNNYGTYGVLYNWLAAKTVCPSADGWHLPTDDEWEQLAQYVSDQKGPYDKISERIWPRVGKHLKATTGWNDNGNGSDDFGFSGLPGGTRGTNRTFSSIGDYGRWWSATEDSTSNAWHRNLNYYDTGFNRSSYYGYNPTGIGFSVRCVRDN